MNKFFDRVIYLNDGSVVKLNRMHKLCTKIDLDFESVTIDKNVIAPKDASIASKRDWMLYLSFCKEIKRARREGISKILILSGKIKFVKDFEDYFEIAKQQVSADFDLFYLGYNHLDKTSVDSKSIVQKVLNVEGAFAVGISQDFYYKFLDNPIFPFEFVLDVFLKEIGRSAQVYACIPPLIELTKSQK